MNQKEYELIAGVFKTSLQNFNENIFTVTTIARLMAKRLRREYDNFDQDKFYEACGIE